MQGGTVEPRWQRARWYGGKTAGPCIARRTDPPALCPYPDEARTAASSRPPKTAAISSSWTDSARQTTFDDECGGRSWVCLLYRRCVSTATGMSPTFCGASWTRSRTTGRPLKWPPRFRRSWPRFAMATWWQRSALRHLQGLTSSALRTDRAARAGPPGL